MPPLSPSESPSSLNENGSTNNDSDPESPILVSRFLKALYKGVTFPFPTLRRLALDTTPTSGSNTTSTSSAIQIGFSLRESILAIIVYLVVGAVSYHSTILQGPNGGQSLSSKWSFVDAAYFSVVTFTSVGYGDLCPTSNLGKLFTILFGLSGISILGIVIASIVSKLVSMESEMMNKAKKASRRRVLGFWHTLIDEGDDDNNSVEDGKGKDENNDQGRGDGASTVKANKNDSSSTQQGPLWKHTLQSLLTKSIPAFAVLILGGIGMGRVEGWSVLDSIYYSMITALTLGYGDFAPLTRPGRLWGTVFIPLAVAAAGEVLGNVATTLHERRQNQFYQSLMERELNTERLMEMDTDSNGKVSREEYVAYMLQEMELVSADEFDELHAQFAKLDVNGGGFLDKGDIQLRLEKQQGAKQ